MANLTEHKSQRNDTLANAIQKLSLLKDFMQLKKHTEYLSAKKRH